MKILAPTVILFPPFAKVIFSTLFTFVNCVAVIVPFVVNSIVSVALPPLIVFALLKLAMLTLKVSAPVPPFIMPLFASVEELLIL